MNKQCITIGVLTSTVLLSACLQRQRSVPRTDIVIDQPPILSETVRSSSSSERKLPQSIRIAIPFSPQAPLAKWDAFHEEACEEMSLALVAKYWKKEVLSRNDAEKELQRMIVWERENGFHEDLTMQELAQVSKRLFNLDAFVETNVSLEAIKTHIAAGEPVIVPAAGRDLKNPYYSGAGPWYHALVIVGYEGKNFIVHDVGTKRGENYVYDQELLLSAVHDWTGIKEEIRQGQKSMLIVHGPKTLQ